MELLHLSTDSAATGADELDRRLGGLDVVSPDLVAWVCPLVHPASSTLTVVTIASLGLMRSAWH